MFSGAHLKRRLGQYGAAWAIGFLVSGAGILIGCLFMDMMAAADLVLPFVLGGSGLALGFGGVMTLLSNQTLGTKLAVVLLALALVLPLLWAPVSAAVVIAFFADRSIEYSEVYAAFQIGISRALFPISEWVLGGAVFQSVWQAFQIVASVVGFFSALANIWPIIRRVLGPEPGREAA
ncbi:hypothetical protein [Brevundimonas goettingensis]|uniref:Uncharacterized protein n=1 Tax=Brevundimonas goettingensis TaxID=2774190 RepID=A0A975GV39_9CAUL|nr:hypothetical protein [Brevundimonas goettingensis]QTC90158.1 hypothetical protein IFJ75_12805 [Brevundimonas goettingensis]